VSTILDPGKQGKFGDKGNHSREYGRGMNELRSDVEGGAHSCFLPVKLHLCTGLLITEIWHID